MASTEGGAGVTGGAAGLPPAPAAARLAAAGHLEREFQAADA
jgi:hypothetical protein